MVYKISSFSSKSGNNMASLNNQFFAFQKHLKLIFLTFAIFPIGNLDSVAFVITTDTGYNSDVSSAFKYVGSRVQDDWCYDAIN